MISLVRVTIYLYNLTYNLLYIVCDKSKNEDRIFYNDNTGKKEMKKMVF